MKNNILSLNSIILNHFEQEQNKNEEQLKLINSLIHGLFDKFVIVALTKIKNQILNSYAKDMYIAKTKLLIFKYSTILKRPLKNTDALIIEQKNKIIKDFLIIARDTVRKKSWTSIFLPKPSEEESVQIDCICGNIDSEKFETDEFNRKTCLECSTQEHAIETGVTHKDYNRVNVVGKFIYNRVLHFQDCIKQYQGKQNCKISDKIYEDLEQKFIAYRLLYESKNEYVRYSKITRTHILMFLKQLNHAKHYENTNLIFFTLTNKRVDNIGYLEQQLLEDFKELVALYDNLHGKDKPQELKRKNFMNVQYLLFQLLRRHKHPCKIEDFTILKTVDRKLFHDTICRNLFEILGWNFTPTF